MDALTCKIGFRSLTFDGAAITVKRTARDSDFIPINQVSGIDVKKGLLGGPNVVTIRTNAGAVEWAVTKKKYKAQTDEIVAAIQAALAARA